MAKMTIVTKEIAPLPKRPDDAHKGSVGRALIIGGCDEEVTMVGAPALAAQACLRSGVGLIQIVLPQSLKLAAAVLTPGATTRTLPPDPTEEALRTMIEDFQADVIALGPGLGRSISPETLRAFLTRSTLPIVLDADGLNALARCGPAEIPTPSRVVLTPHPGEGRRLLSGLGIESKAMDRQAMAKALFEAYRTVVVLKGKDTLVTNGERLYVNETGNPGMATAGAGDVLTGVITALIGQQMEPFEAAILGVYLHGLAGDFAAHDLGQYSMIAEDIIDFLPSAFAEVET